MAMLLLWGSGAGLSAAQTTASSPPPGLVLAQVALGTAALAGLPRRTVTVTEDSGIVTYSGVDLGALLAKNGAPQGAALRGAAASDYVLVRASDGYRAVFALAELDAGLTDKVVLLADARNGAPLGADSGPFRIVVPDEKHHVRWVRNVTDVQVIHAP